MLLSAVSQEVKITSYEQRVTPLVKVTLYFFKDKLNVLFLPYDTC